MKNTVPKSYQRLVARQWQTNDWHAIVDSLADRIHSGVSDKHMCSLEYLDLRGVGHQQNVGAVERAIYILVVGGPIASRHNHRIVVGVVFACLDKHLEQAGVFIIEHCAHRHVDDGLEDEFKVLASGIRSHQG